MVKSFVTLVLFWIKTCADNVGSAALAFVPAATLAAFWMGGESVLILVALGLPLIMMLGGHLPKVAMPDRRSSESRPLNSPEQLRLAIDQSATHYINGGPDSLLLMIDLPRTTRQQSEALGLSLRSALRRSDLVALSGPHRLEVFMRGTEQLTPSAAKNIAKRLHSQITSAVKELPDPLGRRSKIGYCLISQSPDVTTPSILQSAEAALKDAQSRTRTGIVPFDQTNAGGSLRSELIGQVTSALENGQIVAWFQPQVRISDGTVIGAEALARWIHPEHGIVAPQEFLTAVRQAGAWSKLTDLMISSALQAAHLLDTDGMRLESIGVNFAQDDLSDDTLPDRIKWALDEANLTADRLAIEVLEGVVAMDPTSQITTTLNRLSQMGCPIDLDDFGTGHASITSLRNFNPDRVKIDRSFIADCEKDPKQSAMLETVVMMTHRLGLVALTEGVETQAQLDILGGLDCDQAQGYGLAKPMPLADLRLWMQDKKPAQAKQA